jgi:ribosome-binding protein aMBF1 (putative translation factor)
MKDLSCVICGIKIQGNYITYMPENSIICSNECLIKYRKKRNEITKAN